jgi:hypothetical protein
VSTQSTSLCLRKSLSLRRIPRSKREYLDVCAYVDEEVAATRAVGLCLLCDGACGVLAFPLWPRASNLFDVCVATSAVVTSADTTSEAAW